MFTYTIYKELKQQLTPVAPCFFYINQYLKSKDNTSYKVPAIYIETPKNNKVDKFPRQVKVLLQAQFKIHYISYAPFKSSDNAVQDSAILAHQNALTAINERIEGLVLKDAQLRLLTQQFVIKNVSEMNFEQMCIYSVITYTTDVYNRG